jgi:fumarate reductase flavoprotein subunit
MSDERENCTALPESGVEEDGTGLSRRTFLRGAAAGLLGIGTVGVLQACGGTPEGSQQPDGSGAAAEKDEPELSPTETIEADLVVVGGGGGGMAAAVQGKQLGADVILLEKEAATGGTSMFSEGLFAINSHFQQEEGVDYTTAGVLQQVMEYHHWMADAKLTKNFFDASGETIDWLESIGVVFMGAETLGPSLKTWHTYEGMGAQYTGELLKACEDAGVNVMVNTAAKKLVVDGDKVVGVYCETKDGTIIQINAKAVILASGGYADNPDMINEYTMHNYDDMTVMGSPNRTGDGIQMALAIGADTHVIGTMMMCGGALKGLTASSHLNVCAGRQPLLWVNEHGQRFANEGIVTNFSFTGNAMGLQKKVFNIIDGPTMDHITEVGCYNGRGVYVRPGEPLTKLHEELDQELERGNKDIIIADTIEDLAQQTGIDLKTLQATIEVYNGYCEAGTDSDYGKAEKYLQPVKEGPFYAFKLAKAYYCSVGGLKVNTDNQVLNKDGEAIAGLYAVGCDAGGLYGSSYDVGIAAGSQQGWAVNGGRFAAKHALKA